MKNTDVEQWSAPWHSADVPEHQGSQAALDVAAWRKGQPHANFDAMSWLLSPIQQTDISLLEVGSGTGYLSAVVNWIQPQWEYTGVELSEAMIRYAYEHWPAYYVMGDAQKLPFDDKQFDIVMLATVIQHVADWRKAIREAVRVSSKYVMIHRLQVTLEDTHEFLNDAYEQQIPTRELNEYEFVCFCETEMDLRFVSRIAHGRFQRFNCSYLWEKA